MGPYYCQIYQELFDLLVEKRVDLTLHAHDHTYQRTKQLATNAACRQVPIDAFDERCVVVSACENEYVRGAGAVFVIVGTAGAELWEIDLADSEAGYFVTWMGSNVQPRKGFLRCVVSRTELFCEFVGSTVTSAYADSFRIR